MEKMCWHQKLTLFVKLSYQYLFVLVWATIAILNDTKQYKIVQLHSVVSEFSHVAFCIAQYRYYSTFYPLM
jgi:hypothetical protein